MESAKQSTKKGAEIGDRIGGGFWKEQKREQRRRFKAWLMSNVLCDEGGCREGFDCVKRMQLNGGCGRKRQKVQNDTAW
ncbi:hypothetical protein VNO78_02300 [Psophocarpus tetragonolobus]|uniref:Uncharacterized protein n=1 Tax=Psophocarpus tetragonolobus TaxID=3891 RepID=A0AAN9T2E4_PSOTE